MALLEGQVAIVTGAGRGIGRGEAIALAKEGAAVTLLSRTQTDLDAVAAEIDEVGGKTLTITCDVTQRAEADAAVAKTVETFGTVDILINNAALIPQPHPLETWTEEEVREIWEVGYLGTYNFMQACFPYMQEQRYGRIVNTASGAGHGTMPMWGSYAATKEAVRGLTRIAAKEWGPHNITVNVISPAVLSPLVEQYYPDEESRQALLASGGVVMGRFGDAEADIGRGVIYLVGPDASYVTGVTLSLDGGGAMVV